MVHWLTKASVASLGSEAAGPGEMWWRRACVKRDEDVAVGDGQGRAEKEPEKQSG